MIKIGIGGWTFEPWRGPFYPDGLPQARELAYAAEKLTAIEVNGTFYGSQKPSTFRKWADETPENFVFALKAPRFAVNRRVLAEAGPSIEKFVDSGIAELGTKLGPILWQFAGTKKYDPEDFAAFVKLLPAEAGGIKLRHALEVRHDSFKVPEVVELARKHNAAIVYAHSEDYPAIADPTADFVYARLQQSREAEKTGYSAKEIAAWAKRAELWESGGVPEDLDLLTKAPPKKKRDVFLFFIAGAKVRNPAAAMTMIEKLGA
ncbi:hypothetical protein IZ6_27850 [Terrihabitans soli]|uniref:DUF72 domain-containing protein n=1 Tax=Terrihabitans soli TaxID=708113 RepID=A0A6S6QYB5_9HYPH|nr:DUF72 domain-containing protein [Terrihabitans soli]BCJ92050.1 hypothetical protein IZ6_27850 [Terrihabitans soli]